MRKKLYDDEAETITRRCIELAIAGDSTALRLAVERLLPAVKERSRTKFEMPALHTIQDGDIQTSDASALIDCDNAFIKSCETTALETRLAALERLANPDAHSNDAATDVPDHEQNEDQYDA